MQEALLLNDDIDSKTAGIMTAPAVCLYAVFTAVSGAELVEDVLTVLYELHGANVVTCRIVDGAVGDHDRAALDAARHGHVVALVRTEIGEEVFHDGDDAGRVAVHDVLSEHDLGPVEDVSLVDEEAQVISGVDKRDVERQQREDMAELTERAFACGQRDFAG